MRSQAVIDTQETGWDSALDLLDDLNYLKLTPQRCNLDYWISEVAQGTLSGLVNGHQPHKAVPLYMTEDGPLRASAAHEFAFRALTEIMAARTMSYLAAIAPDTIHLNFILTLAFDEARHAEAFRGHLTELGFDDAESDDTLKELARGSVELLRPLEGFALHVIRERGDFMGGVVINTILVEGLLAPASALSERKWWLLDPAGADIQHGTGIDEVRHLGVGTEIIREYLIKHPEQKGSLLDLLSEGFHVWEQVGADTMMFERERLFQEGMLRHKKSIGHYELIPGLKLIDTTPEQRLALSRQLALGLQEKRLNYIGLTGR